MIDLHCHILPYMDDGPGSMEESIAMAEIAAEDGIHAIVATPHTLNGVYVNTLTGIDAGVAEFRQVLHENTIELQLHAGADIHLCPRLMSKIETGDALTINNAGKYILLELPSQSIPPGAGDEIFSLKLNGISPIITHPERNRMIQEDIDILYGFIRMGALSQVTAMSITGGFGEKARQCGEEMLKRRLVHVIASDAHNAGRRTPVLSEAVERAGKILGNRDEAVRMVTEIPEFIIRGDKPDIPDPR